MIETGNLREENPLDQSDEFGKLILACRHGDLRQCQQLISQGVNINGRDRFDYTPLIIASLCGHYELVELLLESGASAERNTFQGERCIYNALNDRIRKLLLEYDFSKSSDPYVYWSTHIFSLLTRTTPRTSDISLTSGSQSFGLHKFLLAARTPYFLKNLDAQPDTVSWDLAACVPVESVQVALRYIYLGDLPKNLVPPGSALSEEEVACGLDEIGKKLEIEQIWEPTVAGNRRLARQRFQDEEERALQQIGSFFKSRVLGHKMVVDADQVRGIKWKHDNPAFADVLLCSNEAYDHNPCPTPIVNGGCIHIDSSRDSPKQPHKSVLYPVHKAILIRSEYFDKMFSGEFVESQRAEHLRIVTIDFSPSVVELVLTFMYTENTIVPLEHALDVLYAADMLFLDALKNKAAQAISTLGSGTSNALVDLTHKHTNGDSSAEPQQESEQLEIEPVNIYDVVHVAWDLRVRRLEEFAARYLAYRLEDYIDEMDFQDLVRESADKIQKREETDTIELLDDIRHYLSERFRLRFENPRLDEMMVGDQDEVSVKVTAALTEKGGQFSNGNGAEGGRDVVTPAKNDGESGKAGAVLALDGTAAEDEFVLDSINYQLLLRKIDAMLERLKLDA